MDSISARSFVSYRYEVINWNPIRPAVMGLQSPTTNVFYNYPGNVTTLDRVIGYKTSTDIL